MFSCTIESRLRERSRRHRLLLAIVFGMTMLSSAASRGSPHTALEHVPIEVTLKTVTEDALHGRLVTLSRRDGARIRIDGGKERRIPLADLVRLTTTALPSTNRRGESTLTLAGGDLLHGQITGAGGEAVVVETVDIGSITVSLDTIKQLNTKRAQQPAHRAAVEWFDRTKSVDVERTFRSEMGSSFRSDEDVILLTNSDIVRGFVTAIDTESVSIDTSLGETKVPVRLVVAVRLSSPPAARLDRLHFVVTFRSSGRLTFSELDWSGNVVEARLRDGRQVRIEAERIVGVDFVGGRWDWLSAHQPISYQHTPMLSLGWEYENDRNVLGGPITVGGETFEHGIGVHSRSSLTYDLKGAFGTFATHFGIDDDQQRFVENRKDLAECVVILPERETRVQDRRVVGIDA